LSYIHVGFKLIDWDIKIYQNISKYIKIYQNISKQAGAELCQAQVKLGIAIIEIFLSLIENRGCL
jgi:hypothetical protein